MAGREVNQVMQAEAYMARYGEGAVDRLCMEISEAVACGDDDAVTYLDAILQQVEGMLHGSNSA